MVQVQAMSCVIVYKIYFCCDNECTGLVRMVGLCVYRWEARSSASHLRPV